MRNNRILMTGATGFLGSNLAKALVAKGNILYILVRQQSNTFRLNGINGQFYSLNINDISIAECLAIAKPDTVIHCATDYGRKQVDPSAVIEANLILPLKLLELSRKYNVKCFINTDTFLDKGINYYSLSKKQFKDWLETFSSELICINVVLEHFYGPFDDKTKFVSFIVEKMLGMAVEIDLTEGKQKRDFVFINDVIDAFICIIDQTKNHSCGLYEYGVGTNKLVTIRELVETIRTISDNETTKLNFGRIAYRRNEIMESNIDTKSIRLLGWDTKYTLAEGLQCTIDAEKKIRK